MAGSYQATTRGVTISVQTAYPEDQSDPDKGSWVWAYQVRIENAGPETVQLLRRTWRIVDGGGRVEVIEGPGVVGKTPVLPPGTAFEYMSGTPLQTPSGFMDGTYHMVVPATREAFDAAVPPFSLDSPGAGQRVH